ncbi:MAG: LysR substrate-binding domain-containing protein [Pseudomonadota bacterium]
MRHLRYFVAVAEELHFGRAARRLHICQPPLSQQIKDVERELGVLLFHRTHKKISLTEAGTAFLEDAREILRRVNVAAERVRGVAAGILGRISMGFVLPAMDTFLPNAIREFRSQNPGIEMELHELGTLAQLDALRTGRIQVGVVRLFQQETAGLVVETIAEEPYILALPAKHPLVSLKAVPLAALDGERLIFFPRRTHPRLYDRILACCSAVGCTPRISQETTTKTTAIALAAAGIGVTLVPESSKKQRRSGVVYRPIEGDLPMVELVLIRRKGFESPSLQKLTDTVLTMRPSQKAP